MNKIINSLYLLNRRKEEDKSRILEYLSMLEHAERQARQVDSDKARKEVERITTRLKSYREDLDVVQKQLKAFEKVQSF